MSALKKPTNYDQLYPGRFLKAGEFEGKKVTLTIADADLEELEGEKGPQVKAIVSFKETPKKLVTCKTNGLCIKAMFGPLIKDWIGKRVVLFPDTWNGEPAVRVFGSPDIANDMDVEIKLPRKRPFTKTMKSLAKAGGKPAPRPASETADAEPDFAEPGSAG